MEYVKWKSILLKSVLDNQLGYKKNITTKFIVFEQTMS